MLFSSNKWLYWIYHISKHIKWLRVQVSILFIAKDVAIIRIVVTGGGHPEFSNENVDEQIEIVFQSFRANITEKNYLKSIWKHHNVIHDKLSSLIFFFQGQYVYVSRLFGKRVANNVVRTLRQKLIVHIIMMNAIRSP